MSPEFVTILAGIAVVGLIGGIGLVLLRSPTERAEQRLDDLSGKRRPGRRGASEAASLLRPSALDLNKAPGWFHGLSRLEGLRRLYEQADVGMRFRTFAWIALGLMVAAAALGYFLHVPLAFLPAVAGAIGFLPLFWLVLRKRKRIKKFLAQMPDALELVGRALRAGHGLASGLRVVSEEMPAPIAVEFGRVFEEQNLGIPIEDSLRGLAERVPMMDVRFFVTAVIIQRATGGDLAEVLDKIGRLIRERFQILGQVQALTAEGRLSGVVLLGMPPTLLAVTYYLNPDYVSLLFNTPLGTKMLTWTGVLQVVGAVAIKKIISIKV